MPVRPAETGDVPRIVELWKEMWDLHAAFDPDRYVVSPAWNLVIPAWIEENLANARSLVLVTEEEGEILAYLLALILENPPVVPHQFFGYISELAVSQPHRGRGLGRSLLEAGRAWFRGKNISVVELSVSAFNTNAVRFWKREGFSDYLLRLRMDL